MGETVSQKVVPGTEAAAGEVTGLGPDFEGKGQALSMLLADCNLSWIVAVLSSARNSFGSTFAADFWFA
jgi:hypothetical protein